MRVPRNLWYAAAWCEEVESAPFSRKILGESVLLFRDGNGEAVALGDTCPHRFAPLHKGKLVDGTIECPYHGLRFDSRGRCVHNPHGNGAIPASARVRKYPLVERHKMLWIWPGDPEKADASKIPQFGFLEDPNYEQTRGIVFTTATRFELVLDNLMDLTHIGYLHLDNVGSDAVARGRMEVVQNGNNVSALNLYPNGRPAPVFAHTGACSPDTMVDYWINVHWHPLGSIHIDAGVIPLGQPKEGSPFLSSAQILTPETETSTHYFWRFYRNYQYNNAELTGQIEAAIKSAFEREDEAMIRSVQERMNGHDLWSLNPVLLPTDSAAVRVRRVLNEMIEAENQPSA